MKDSRDLPLYQAKPKVKIYAIMSSEHEYDEVGDG
jgi:hypothetical protein